MKQKPNYKLFTCLETIQFAYVRPSKSPAVNGRHPHFKPFAHDLPKMKITGPLVLVAEDILSCGLLETPSWVFKGVEST